MDRVVIVDLLVVALLGLNFQRTEERGRKRLEECVVGSFQFDLSGSRESAQHYGILGVDVLNGARDVFPQRRPQERIVVVLANVTL